MIKYRIKEGKGYIVDMFPHCVTVWHVQTKDGLFSRWTTRATFKSYNEANRFKFHLEFPGVRHY